MEVSYDDRGGAGARRQVLPAGFTEPTDWWTRGYSIAPDGRFLAIRDIAGPAPAVPQIHMIANWMAELKRLAPRP